MAARLPWSARAATVAASTKISRKGFSRIRTTDWQRQAWEYYDTVPELRSGVNWMAQACSQMRLYVGKIDPDGSADPEPVTDPALTAPLKALFGGIAYQPNMLRRMALQLGAVGETFLITAQTEHGRIWHVASGDEFSKRAGTITLKDNGSGEPVPIEDVPGNEIIRIWMPHGRLAWQADAAPRALLGVCAEIMNLSGYINAVAESRQAGNGLLVLAQDAFSATFPDELTQSMVTPITDRDSAASVVPVIATTAGDDANKSFKYQRFDSPLTPEAPEMRKDAIERLATGHDAPREVTLGIAAVNHWNVEQISEDQQRFHIDPMMAAICAGIARSYWAPLIPDPAAAAEHTIWFDASRLTTPTNKTEEARAYYSLGLLSAKSALRAGGWSEEDLPDKNEATSILLTQLARAGVDPALVAPYLQALGVTPTTIQSEQLQPDTQIDDTSPAPAITAAARPKVTGTDLDLAYAGVLRALEICGKKLLSATTREKRRELRDLQPWDLYSKLDPPTTEQLKVIGAGAFDLADKIAPGKGQPIRDYVRTCLTSGSLHSREDLQRFLANQAGAREHP